MTDDKYKFTGDIDKITLKEGNPLEAYLQDGTKLTSKDMGEYYAYSDGNNLWRVPKQKPKINPAKDIDKVILGTMALGISPLAAPELFGSLVTNIAQNPQLWGQALQRTAAGMAGYEGVNELNRQINGETWGEGVHRLSGGRVPVWAGDLTNPGGFLEGVVTNAGNKLLNASNRIVNQAADNISKRVAPYQLYRNISKYDLPTVVKPEVSLYNAPSTETAVSQPYVRWSQKGFLNEAQDVYLTQNPNQKFQIVKDVDNPQVGVFNNNGNGEYSLHFHTKREGFTPEQKDAMFSTVADVIPEGGIVSTWGNVTKGGFHGLRRFGNQFNWPQIGIRENGSYISKEDINPIDWLWGKKDQGIPVFHKPTTTRSFMYDSKGNFVPNPNYYYRTGWGIIDDALDSGVIRVPEGDYKPAVLQKYPFLNDDNPFSTMKVSHKFPYFSEGNLSGKGNGSASTARLKYSELPPEPEDLIAIHKDIPGVQWSGAGKWSTLQPDKTPAETGGRATPLINGETNKFPTSQAELFRYNTETKQYEPINRLKGIRGIDGSVVPTFSFSSFQQIDPKVNPLYARLSRMQEKVKNGVIPETKQEMLFDATPEKVKEAVLKIDPNMSGSEVQKAVDIALNKGYGVHIPIGNDIENIGGLSIVDRKQAAQFLQSMGIEPTPRNIDMIMGHEVGHQTYEIPEEAKSLLYNYTRPEEFFTQAGQILDNAGIKNTLNNPVSYENFMNMLAQYQKQGNIDNGISQLAKFMESFKTNTGNKWKDAVNVLNRNKLMKYINSLSAGLYGAYLINNE